MNKDGFAGLRSARLILLITLVLLLFISCATESQNYQALLKEWNEVQSQLISKTKYCEGKHYNVVINWLGPPSQTLDDGQGGKILIFTKQKTSVTPGYSTAYASGYRSGNTSDVWGTAREYPATTDTVGFHLIFWVNEKGYIYKSQFKDI
jgi:hypothetical protein